MTENPIYQFVVSVNLPIQMTRPRLRPLNKAVRAAKLADVLREAASDAISAKLPQHDIPWFSVTVEEVPV